MITGRQYKSLFDGISTDIGYCPQYDCVTDDLTVEDYLFLFGRIRSIRCEDLRYRIESLVRLFVLDIYLDQYLHELSGGTLRRIHCALACLGPPSLILLDEPTTGVDPFSRRRMRDVFQYALACQSTIILTSHSMDECEFLCDRLGIMAKGQFQCLGNIQDLKNRFGRGVFLDVKFSSSKRKKHLENFLRTSLEIPMEILHETDETFLIQFCQLSSVRKLFILIEQIQNEFDIESYSIQQTTLEQIFLSFQQTNEMSLVETNRSIDG